MKRAGRYMIDLAKRAADPTAMLTAFVQLTDIAIICLFFWLGIEAGGWRDEIPAFTLEALVASFLCVFGIVGSLVWFFVAAIRR